MNARLRRHRASTSFQGSALECTVFEALPREWVRFDIGEITTPQAEPARHWVTRQSQQPVGGDQREVSFFSRD